MTTKPRRRLLPLLIASCFCNPAALANPAGPQVMHGQASFAQQGNTLSIANTPGTIIHWQNFSINPGEVTRFLQQNPHSAVLNRIVGQDPSQILGALQSNGRVFLINPNGIVFGQGAQVDVNGLVASTLNISNDDFLSGKMQFKAGAKAGAVQQQGVITTPQGGQVYLIAPQVANSGIITSPKGEVLLAAGHTVQLVDSAQPDLHVVISAPEHEALNLGQIIAQGGKTGIYGALVQQRGIVNANSAVVGDNGKIVFKASRDTVLDAHSRSTATGVGQGGHIQVLGERVGVVSGAQIDASGRTGGGEVLIGGDYQGRNPGVQNARRTFVGKEASIRADATDNGHGGKVIVWSDEATRMYGTISARGGQNAGNGGFVETSGKYLDMQGQVDTRAPQGRTGQLLLDPTDIYIANDTASAVAAGMQSADNSADTSAPYNFAAAGPAGDSLMRVSTLTNALANASVSVSTANGAGAGSGKITVVDEVAWSQGTDLSLMADAGIDINAPLRKSGGGTIGLLANSGDITQNAAGQINAPYLAVKANNGSVLLANASSGNEVGILAGSASGGNDFRFHNATALTVNAVTSTATGALDGLKTNNLPIRLTAQTGDLTVANSQDGVDAGTANIYLTAITGTVKDSGGAIKTTGELDVKAGNAIALGTANHQVDRLIAAQTDSAATVGNIDFKNAAALTVKSVTQAATNASGITLKTEGASNGITFTESVDTVSPTALVTLTAGAAGALVMTCTTCAITANGFDLQSSSNGPIGAPASPLLTKSVGGGSTNATFSIGNGAGAPASAFISHTGAATLSTVDLAANTVFGFDASSDLTVNTNVNAGTVQAKLGSGNLLKLAPGTTLTGQGNVTLNADRMDLTGATINAGTNTLWLKPKTTDRDIKLGSTADTAADALEISDAEIAAWTGNGVLQIGANTGTGKSKNIQIVDSINVPASGALFLETDGSIWQSASKTITASKLAVRASNNTGLDEANQVGALSVQMLGTNKNFSFTNGNHDLEIAGGANKIANIDGITVNISGSYSATATTPEGVVRLKTGGNLTQTGPIGGKAIYAEGRSVALTEYNPTGIIAGKATGTATTDVFHFTSSNPIAVTTVNNFAGITTAAAPGSNTVELTSSAGAIHVSAPINAGSGKVVLDAQNAITGTGSIIADTLEATAGDGIALEATQVNRLALENTGTTTSISINNTANPLNLLDVTQYGIGNISIRNTGELRVHAGYTVTSDAGEILLQAKATGSTADRLIIEGAVHSTSGNIRLEAGDAIIVTSTGSVDSNSGDSTKIFKFAYQNGVASPPPPAPTLDQCTANPSLSGCSTVLPTLDQCTATPSLAGCSVILPSVDQCTTTPTLAGCSAVLPSLNTCTTTPATPGCSVVLPPLSSCTVTPSLAGCAAVLPSLGACTATPSLEGCSVILPSLNACTTTPSLDGCSAVLPTLANCTATPLISGCSAVLPSLATCTATPDAAGCSAVLPTLSSCTTTPTLSGCSAVLPALSTCTVTPSLAGCAAVLPSLDACAATPTLAGCTVVLPTLSSCTSAPTQPGCAAVLPSLSTCTTSPALAGCAVVLPTMNQCETSPTLAGCSAVLPSLSQCATSLSLPGCSAVLPTVSQCAAAPGLSGCEVVMPVLNQCTLDPAAPGCEVVLPPVQVTPEEPVLTPVNPIANTVKVTTAATINTVITTTTAVTESTASSSAATYQGSAGTGLRATPTASGSQKSDDKKSDDKKDEKKDIAGLKDNGAKKNEPAKKMYCN